MVHYRASSGNFKKATTACGKKVDIDTTSPWAYRVTCPACKKAIRREGLGARK